MITKATTDAVKDVTPPAIVATATLFGLSLQDWVLYLAIAYSAIRLLMLIPKVIGCGRCFYRNKTCTLACKGHSTEEGTEL